MYKHWQLRKYTAIAAKQKERKREMQYARSVRGRRAGAVPFGVRAIESGIEVDGVWISRPNTPTPSSPASLESQERDEPISDSFGTPHERQYVTSVSRITTPQPVHGHNQPASSSSSVSSRSSQISTQQMAQSGTLPARNASSVPESTSRMRNDYRPQRSSHLRYSSVDFTEEDSNLGVGAQDRHGPVPMQTLDGRHRRFYTYSDRQTSLVSGADCTTLGSPAGYGSRNICVSSERSSDIADQDIPKHLNQPNLANSTVLHTRSPEAPMTTQGDHNHTEYDPGRDMAKSTIRDQTSARDRFYAVNGDHSFVGSQMELEPSPDHDTTRHDSSPKNPIIVSTVPFEATAPKDEPWSPFSFQNFLHSDLDGTARQTVPLLSDVGEAGSQHMKQPLQVGDPNRRSRQSLVVRKVNSGFEILRPGTFPRQTQDFDHVDVRPKQKAGEKSPPRRLKKKRGNSTLGDISRSQEVQ